MGIFDNSADFGKQMIFNFIKERMKEKKISQYKLSKLTGIPENTLSQNFNNQSEMSFSNFLKILGALEIRPFLIPAEIDKSEYQRIFSS